MVDVGLRVSAGMRFPELVAGGFRHITDDTYEVARGELMSSAAVWVSPSEWETILADFAAARQHFDLALQVKTSFLQKLPWLLGGLAHHDHEVQKMCAQKCIDAYDSTPEVCEPFTK
jgi:hypothetical protein